MQTLDWEQSRLIAIEMSANLINSCAQTDKSISAIGVTELIFPIMTIETLDYLHHFAAQKMLDFLTTDQIDGGTDLRAVALSTVVGRRTPQHLTTMAAHHSCVSDFRSQKEAAHQKDVATIKKDLEALRKKFAQHKDPDLKADIRLLNMKLMAAQQPKRSIIPASALKTAWEDMICDTIAAAEKSLSVGALYVRNPNQEITTQVPLALEDVVQQRPTAPTKRSAPM